MRRLVHGRTNAVDGRVRWTAAILGFALPALALLLAAPDPGLLVVLSPPQQLGLLTECWSYFAQGQHRQDLQSRALG